MHGVEAGVIPSQTASPLAC